VGDHVLLTADSIIDQQTPLLVQVGHLASDPMMWEAKRPGIGRIVGSKWSVFLRVSRQGYIGRGLYRHLEPAEGDETS
jgi:hypothetical protein